ncbi:hypothetical protein SAMN05660420_00822 [Desulfuromusa kysingii]|uniref:Uncharacterized protein n=1 Tax=Desulfuromusa kysingii TaxID=37625 RepID=A0A1H3X6R8_9BACT|nr:hypothetical protein [Desulfuromusa kysingii]SDZ94344.1 hypothetical protein SAMN05660420_00822 [Desulfuromusa kysingii]
MKTTIFALTVLISVLVPITPVILKLLGLGGMYGKFWGQFPPSLYIASVQIFHFGISLLLALLIINRLNLRTRIPSPIAGKQLIWIGGLLLITPGFLRIFTSMIEGGGASFALMSVAAPIVRIAKPLFFIGVFFLLLAIKPSKKYSFPE